MIELRAKAMDSIDLYRHGWASLKLRCPRLRTWEGRQGQVQQLCEIYSEVILLHDLMSKAGDEEAAAKYEELRLALEEAVHHYLVFYNDAEGDVPLATISAWASIMNDLPTKLNDGFGRGLSTQPQKVTRTARVLASAIERLSRVLKPASISSNAMAITARAHANLKS